MIRAEKKRPVQRNMALRKHKHGCPRRENVAGLGIAVSQMPRPLQNKNSILNLPIFRILCSFYDGCKDLMMLMLLAWVLFYRSHLLQNCFTASTCLFATDDAAFKFQKHFNVRHVVTGWKLNSTKTQTPHLKQHHVNKQTVIGFNVVLMCFFLMCACFNVFFFPSFMFAAPSLFGK